MISLDGSVIYESQSSRLMPLYNTDNHSKSRKKSSKISSLKTIESATMLDDSDFGATRGVHVLVLNEYHGYIMSQRVFDTYSPQQDEELCLYLNMIHDGRIIIFAVKDEASFKMPMNSPARIMLQRLGSKHIMKLKWRDMWAFVVRKTTNSETNIHLGESRVRHLLQGTERLNLGEVLSKSSHFSDWAPPVVVEAQIELLKPEYLDRCNWSSRDEGENRRRSEFCDRIEGYGRVCDCEYPSSITFKSQRVSIY